VVIPADWKEVRLGEICEIYQPTTIGGKDFKESGEFVVYGANGPIGRYNRYNHEDSEVTVTCRGATCGTVNVTPPRVWITGNAMVVRPKAQTLSKMMLKYILQALDYSDVITGAAQPQITGAGLSPCQILVPPLKEQEAIAEALSDADAAIESLDALIAKKRDVKQAAMQQLLTGRTRLPGFTTDWKEVRLGEIYEVKSSKRVLQSEWRQIGVPFFRGREVSELASRGKVNNDLFIDMTHYERLRRSYGVPRIDDILLTAIGTIGNAYRVKTTEPFYFKDASVIWLSGRGGVVGSYVEHWMKSKGFRDQLPSDNGTTVDTLTIGFTAGMRVILPSLMEQEAIAEALTVMDDELEALTEQVLKMRMIKEGMMQDLLTGKVRLV
jgi:type I restriction enzyme S subunit